MLLFNNKNQILNHIQSGKILPEIFEFDGVVLEAVLASDNNITYACEQGGLSVTVETSFDGTVNVKVFEEL